MLNQSINQSTGSGGGERSENGKGVLEFGRLNISFFPL